MPAVRGCGRLVFGPSLAAGLPVSLRKERSVPNSSDSRSSMAAAMRWVSEITTVAFMMAVPAGVGYWLDEKWGSSPWCVIVGAVIGFATGFRQLLSMVERQSGRDTRSDHDKSSGPGGRGGDQVSP